MNRRFVCGLLALGLLWSLVWWLVFYAARGPTVVIPGRDLISLQGLRLVYDGGCTDWRWDYEVCRLNHWRQLPAVRPGGPITVPDWRPRVDRQANSTRVIGAGHGSCLPVSLRQRRSWGSVLTRRPPPLL